MVRRPLGSEAAGAAQREGHREAASASRAASEPGDRRLERCPLCGTEFDASGQGCRPSCPMSAGCSVVCCPSCGYSFPQETGLAGRLRAFLQRRRTRP